MYRIVICFLVFALLSCGGGGSAESDTSDPTLVTGTVTTISSEQFSGAVRTTPMLLNNITSDRFILSDLPLEGASGSE